MRKTRYLFLAAAILGCATAAYSVGKETKETIEKISTDLFPDLSDRVVDCYSVVTNGERNDFRWEKSQDEHLFFDVYLSETFEVLSGNKAPKLRKKIENLSKMKGILQDDLIIMIGCARYITGKSYRNDYDIKETSRNKDDNAFTAALQLFSGFKPETRELLFEDFDSTYTSFTVASGNREDELTALRNREQEFALRMSTDPVLSEKLSRMSESEISQGGKPEAVWDFAQEIARSSYGFCKEFQPPSFLGGIRDYFMNGWNSLIAYKSSL
ncbi:MAG: hypothetical protein H6618_04735 [Deltaproteobacteria bacterium]|nr:hypothetical protein [Deltaproteobacteria bacterium]